MKQLSGMDASFLYFETPNAPGHIFSVWIYDQSSAPGGKVTFKEILDHVGSRLHVSRTFRQRLVRGAARPRPSRTGSRTPTSTSSTTCATSPCPARATGASSASRWRGCTRDRSTGPPAVGDVRHRGPRRRRRAARRQLRDHDEDPPRRDRRRHPAGDHQRPQRHSTPTRRRRPPAADGVPSACPSSLELLSRAAANAAVRPMRMARLTAAAVPGDAERRREQRARQNFDLSATSPAPRTRFSGTVTTHRVIEARRFELATAKAIKAAVPGATINDVAITVVGGALREYLREHGELPEQALRVMAPISTRTADQAGTAGNQVSAMIVTAGTDVADPRERLAAVHESTAASKAAAEAAGAQDLAQFSEMMPGGLVALAARDGQPVRDGHAHQPAREHRREQRPRLPGPAVLRRCPPGDLLRRGRRGRRHGPAARGQQLRRPTHPLRRIRPRDAPRSRPLRRPPRNIIHRPRPGHRRHSQDHSRPRRRPRPDHERRATRPRKAAAARPRKAAAARPRKAAAAAT